MKAGIVVFALICCATSAVAQQKAPVFDPMNPPETARADPGAEAKTEPKSGVKAATKADTAAPMVVTPTPEPAAPVVLAGPRVVSFVDVEAEVGKTITVKTHLHTTRKGTLKRFNRAVLVIQDMSRGFAMDIEIPRDTVAEVTVLN